MFSKVKSSLKEQAQEDEVIIGRETLELVFEVLDEAEQALNDIAGRGKKYLNQTKRAQRALDQMDFISKRNSFKKGMNQ